VAHEHYSARRHPEFVVLEIGSGLGAMIVQTDASMHGKEVEISRANDDARRSHKEVLERLAGGSPAYTAVFDRLPAGDYTLWVDGVPRAQGVTVAGGRIAQLDWRTGTLAPAG
jgi:hypothetical protein